MSDRIARAMVVDRRLVAVACVATDVARDARKRHGLAPTSAALLGEGLTAGLLVASLQKHEERRINLQVSCNGPARGLFVDASPLGQVRGYIRAKNLRLPGTFDSGLLLGQSGYVAVLRELEGEFYRSSVDLGAGSLTLDLEHYYRQSEQTATALQLEALAEDDEALGWVGGVLVQRLPDGDDDEVEKVREQLRSGAVAAAVRAGHRSAHQLLEALFGPTELLADQDVAFHCGCSRERVDRALVTIAPADLRTMIDEDGQAEVNCDFCAARYLVTKSELEQIHALASARQATPVES